MSESEQIKANFEGKEIVYNIKTQKWTLDGVHEDDVKKVSRQTWLNVGQALKKNVKEYEDRIKREEAEKQGAELAEKKRLIKDVKTRIEALIDTKEYDLEYRDLTDDRYSHRDSRYVQITKNNVRASITYYDRVYGSGAWDSHRTNKPWLVESPSKDVRFAKFESAVKGAIKRMQEKIDANTRQAKANSAKEQLYDEITKKLKKDNLSFREDVKYNHAGYRTTTTKRMIVFDTLQEPEKEHSSKKIEVRGTIHDSEKMQINRVQIQGEFTVKQFKQIRDLVASMKAKADSGY